LGHDDRYRAARGHRAASAARADQGARHSHRRRTRSVRVHRLSHRAHGRHQDGGRRAHIGGAARIARRAARAGECAVPRSRASRRVVRLERKILLGFGAGVVVGLVARAPGMDFFAAAVRNLEPVGTVFIRLITMVVVPLVIASVFVGVASLGDVRSLGRIGAKTLLFFFGTTLVAALIGLLAATVANVGAGFSLGPQDAAQANGPAAVPTVPGVVQTLVNLVPQNPFAAAAQGGADLLPLIVAVCFFGAAATVVDPQFRQPVVRFFQG